MPRVDGDAELRLLYEGAIPRQELSIAFLLELRSEFGGPFIKLLKACRTFSSLSDCAPPGRMLSGTGKY